MMQHPKCLEAPAPAAPVPTNGGPTGDRGASIVEYALLVALIAVVCIGAVTYFGGETGQSFSTSGSSMFAS